MLNFILLFDPFATENEQIFQKSLLSRTPELFLPFLIKNNYFWTKSSIFFWQSMGTQSKIFTHFYFILLLQYTKKQLKKFFL
jgi:hypothetical protein